jgi:hypothetical protein
MKADMRVWRDAVRRVDFMPSVEHVRGGSNEILSCQTTGPNSDTRLASLAIGTWRPQEGGLYFASQLPSS